MKKVTTILMAILISATVFAGSTTTGGGGSSHKPKGWHPIFRIKIMLPFGQPIDGIQ